MIASSSPLKSLQRHIIMVLLYSGVSRWATDADVTTAASEESGAGSVKNV